MDALSEEWMQGARGFKQEEGERPQTPLTQEISPLWKERGFHIHETLCVSDKKYSTFSNKRS